MSLLKWQEMARSKSALGKKINLVHKAITQNKLGEETSQIGFEKTFRPITGKLDDVIASNLLRMQMPLKVKPQPQRKKAAEIDYLPEVDPFEEMDIEGLLDDAVPPQAEKQIPPSPPFYSPPSPSQSFFSFPQKTPPPSYKSTPSPATSSAKAMPSPPPSPATSSAKAMPSPPPSPPAAKAKPKSLHELKRQISKKKREQEKKAAAPRPQPQPLPPPTYEELFKTVGDNLPVYERAMPVPEYELTPTYGEFTRDESDAILNDLNLHTYQTANQELSNQTWTNQDKNTYLHKLIKVATHRRNQLKGYKTAWTMKYQKGEITEEQKRTQQAQIDRSFKVLNRYIKYYNTKFPKQGSGMKGGSIRFFSNPKELLKKLEVIIGSILAGNTNREIRNTGVEILDLLLKEGVINRSHHEKLFKNYFNL